MNKISLEAQLRALEAPVLDDGFSDAVLKKIAAEETERVSTAAKASFGVKEKLIVCVALCIGVLTVFLTFPFADVVTFFGVEALPSAKDIIATGFQSWEILAAVVLGFAAWVLTLIGGGLALGSNSYLGAPTPSVR